METCENQSFFSYFEENMNALGYSVPRELMGTQEKAANTIATILGAIDSLGKNTTLRDVAFRMKSLDKFRVYGAVNAAAYVGASIGSLAVATGRYSACGASISDVAITLRENGVTHVLPPWLDTLFRVHPEITDRTKQKRSLFSRTVLLYTP